MIIIQYKIFSFLFFTYCILLTPFGYTYFLIGKEYLLQKNVSGDILID